MVGRGRGAGVGGSGGSRRGAKVDKKIQLNSEMVSTNRSAFDQILSNVLCI